MALRLTDEEVYMRDLLADLNGIDGSGVMRMALRKLAKQEGLPPYPGPPEKPAPEKTRARAR